MGKQEWYVRMKYEIKMLGKIYKLERVCDNDKEIRKKI